MASPVAREVETVSALYGQELNRTTYNLPRMNMILDDVHYRKFDIRQADTLVNPQPVDMRFEAWSPIRPYRPIGPQIPST